jgi:protein phosphatase 1 regulatory subunit 11
VGESSSEDDSSSGSDSDNGSESGVDDGAARMVGSGSRRRKRRRGNRHEHGHEHEHGDDCGDKSTKGGRRPSPNAYERMPRSSAKRDPKR